MAANQSVFQTGSSLIDAGAMVRLTNKHEVDERDVTRVAEFFSILRDRLQNELPETANQQLPESFKRSLVQAMEDAKKIKPK